MKPPQSRWMKTIGWSRSLRCCSLNFEATSSRYWRSISGPAQTTIASSDHHRLFVNRPPSSRLLTASARTQPNRPVSTRLPTMLIASSVPQDEISFARPKLRISSRMDTDTPSVPMPMMVKAILKTFSSRNCAAEPPRNNRKASGIRCRRTIDAAAAPRGRGSGGGATPASTQTLSVLPSGRRCFFFLPIGVTNGGCRRYRADYTPARGLTWN